MEIISQILDDPMKGAVLLLFLAVSGGIVAALFFAIVVGLRKLTAGKDIKVAGVELKDSNKALQDVTKGPTDLSKVSYGESSPKVIDRRQSCSRHAEVDEAIDALIDGKAKTAQRIMSMQIRSIRDSEDKFVDAYKDSDPRDVLALWGRFKDELYASAVENHILDHINKDGSILRDYADDRLLPVAQGHRRLSQKYDLPDWSVIETGVYLVMWSALNKFAEIARTEWGSFHKSIRSMTKMVGSDHPAIDKRIERLLEGIGKLDVE